MKLYLSERRHWGKRPGEVYVPRYAGLGMLGGSRELFETSLPRGTPLARLTADRERLSYWMAPGALLRHRFRLGQLIIGKLGDTFLGHLDDRPLITIAGARAGKSSTVLEPNLYLYPGSMLVLDPKGELSATARIRRAGGHVVRVLDAFGITGEQSACFNCLEELEPDDLMIVDRVMSIAAALVPETSGGGNSKYFDDSARALLVGLILFVLDMPDKAGRNLITVRQLLTLSYPPLLAAAEAAADRARLAALARGGSSYPDASHFALTMLFQSMASIKRYDGVAAALGRRFQNMGPNERGAVFSTAAVNTDFLDSLPLRQIIRHSDFKLSELRSDRPTTIFLVLPVGEIERHYRWLRLLVQMACTTLERFGAYPRDRPPILFMMEEFAVLGPMDVMERAAAYFPGFGIKLWIVLQSLEQLTNDYTKMYQTFLGNAGLIQMFAANDGPAVAYAASRMGKLIETFELSPAFSRAKASQLLLMEGEPPAAAMRLSHEDVAAIRAHAANALARQLQH